MGFKFYMQDFDFAFFESGMISENISHDVILCLFTSGVSISNVVYFSVYKPSNLDHVSSNLGPQRSGGLGMKIVMNS